MPFWVSASFELHTARFHDVAQEILARIAAHLRFRDTVYQVRAA